MKKIIVFLGVVASCLFPKAADTAQLPSESRVIGERRMTIIYRTIGNKSRTNLVSWTWEKQVGGKWVIDSRSYYVAGDDVLSEYDFDETGIARELVMRRGDQLVGIKRKGTEIIGLTPQAELDEMVRYGKMGGEAGAVIGGIGGEGKDGKTKTQDEITKELSGKIQELKKKHDQEPK